MRRPPRTPTLIAPNVRPPTRGVAGIEVRLRETGPARGWWDPTRLDQIVANLLSNAIKFGARHPVEIEIAADDDVARLTVRDHGIGIPQGDLERVFGQFERAVPTRHYGGLGLYGTRHLVEAHGGTVGVSSALGRGSEFIVELPRRPQPSLQPDVPRVPPQSAT